MSPALSLYPDVAAGKFVLVIFIVAFTILVTGHVRQDLHYRTVLKTVHVRLALRHTEVAVWTNTPDVVLSPHVDIVLFKLKHITN